MVRDVGMQVIFSLTLPVKGKRVKGLRSTRTVSVGMSVIKLKLGKNGGHLQKETGDLVIWNMVKTKVLNYFFLHSSVSSALAAL